MALDAGLGIDTGGLEAPVPDMQTTMLHPLMLIG